jgi:16S rRNA U516 pseudouridylate synthase RsuA-like enzyme
MTMVRTQIQITEEQARSLKRLAAKEGKSVAELIRISVENLLRAGGTQDPKIARQKALAAAGKLSGPENLAEEHDNYIVGIS